MFMHSFARSFACLFVVSANGLFDAAAPFARGQWIHRTHDFSTITLCRPTTNRYAASGYGGPLGNIVGAK